LQFLQDAISQSVFCSGTVIFMPGDEIRRQADISLFKLPPQTVMSECALAFRLKLLSTHGYSLKFTVPCSCSTRAQ